MANDTQVSTYLQYLPAVLRQGPFLGRFLLAFEAVFSGMPGAPPPTTPLNPSAPQSGIDQWARGNVPGLDQYLDSIATFFDPNQTPPEFLPWLAQWMATSLAEGWDVDTQRRFLTQIMQFYQTRGTKAGIEAVLRFYLDAASAGSPGTVSPVDIVIDDFTGDPDSDVNPYYFQVSFTVRTNDGYTIARFARLAMFVIDQQKPAHTFYSLIINYPMMRIVDYPGQEFQGYPGVIVGYTTGLGTLADP